MNSLLYLNKFFWRYRISIIIGGIFILISNLFALYPAEFVRKAFDSVILSINNNTQSSYQISATLLKYGSLIVVFSVLKGVFMYFMRQTIIVMSRKIEFDLKNEIYKQYQNLSMSFYKKNNTGDLMNRISEDVSRVRMYLGPALMYGINISILFYLVINKMFSINSTLSLYVLIPLPILAITVYFVSDNINKRSERVQDQLSKITNISQENFSGIKIIKSFRSEENTYKLFLNSLKSYTNKQIQLVKIEAVFFPLIITMIGASTILTVYIGGMESYKGNITTGNIAEFIIYVNMLAWPVASIGWITSIIQRASASQTRINNFLLLKPEIQNTIEEHTNINGDINFNNVSFTYENTDIKTLDKISFKIKQGTTFGIFGKTGSGKTTIANLICRLYDADEGEITFGNKNIKNLNLNNLRSYIGYVPQDGYLFSGSITDNISFSDNVTDHERIIAAANKSEMLNEINNFLDGFETIVGERGVQLSGGQRQRIAIARTFYKKSELLIFDDCLSAIDADKEQKILKNLRKESLGKTSIIISHRIATLKDSNHIIVVDSGKIIEQGTHKELLKQKGFYFNIEKSQNSSF
tara:strand:- start:19542 stop:21290 length:1749 start_codon:yes stop_codon:yes gene_type:complete